MRDEDVVYYIKTLEMEILALRSVLSEYEGDKTEFTQMNKADMLNDLRNYIARPV